MAIGQGNFTRDLIDLRYEIETLQANDFSYTQRFSANGGEFALQANLFSIDTNGVRTPNPPIVLEPIKVRVRGGLRVSSSVGIGISQYFEDPVEYIVRDGVVATQEKDRIIPALSTLIHFHPYSAGRATIGGTVGVGLPLVSNNSGQAVVFMLGPSLVLGNKDKVILSGGLMGGQVERLGGGLQVGDTFDFTNGLLPTTRLYELGYFFSLSFKLFGS